MPRMHFEEDEELPIDESCAGLPFEQVAYGEPFPSLRKAIDEVANTPNSGPITAYRHVADRRYAAQDTRQRAAGQAYALAHYPDADIWIRTKTVKSEGKQYVYVDTRKQGKR